MRFHLVMLLIVIFVSLGMHGMASAASCSSPACSHPQARALFPAAALTSSGQRALPPS